MTTDTEECVGCDQFAWIFLTVRTVSATITYSYWGMLQLRMYECLSSRLYSYVFFPPTLLSSVGNCFENIFLCQDKELSYFSSLKIQNEHKNSKYIFTMAIVLISKRFLNQ